MIENERKFVIKLNKNFEEIVKKEAEKTLIIEQGYLNSRNKKFSCRVRKTTQDSKNKYYFNYKYNFKSQVIEIETLINKDDYKKLWSQTKNRLNKVRYVVDGWEIDFFKLDNKTYFIMAEIEMPEHQEEPEHVIELVEKNLLYAVPRWDTRFSSRKLCNKVYATNLLNNISNIKGKK